MNKNLNKTILSINQPKGVSGLSNRVPFDILRDSFFIMEKPKLLIHHYVHRKKKKGWEWLSLYLCYCGNKFISSKSNIFSGGTRSCGCFKKEYVANKNRKHNLSKTDLYIKWKSIKSRTSKNYSEKQYYYNKGITVCKEWRDDYMAFHAWAMANGYKKELTIDRIDNSRGYSPENCRFVTNQVNCQNREGVTARDKVLEIKRLVKKGMKEADIIRTTGISRGVVSGIRLNKTFQNIKPKD